MNRWKRITRKIRLSHGDFTYMPEIRPARNRPSPSDPLFFFFFFSFFLSFYSRAYVTIISRREIRAIGMARKDNLSLHDVDFVIRGMIKSFQPLDVRIK